MNVMIPRPFLFALGAWLLIDPVSARADDGKSPIKYPPSPRANIVDDYHGTPVPDPYRSLEDDHAPATRAWVEAQNKVTFDYLGRIPERKAIERRLTQLWNYEKYGVPNREGGHYFYSFNTGLQNQSVLYTVDDLAVEGRVLLDPNTLSSDGTVALAGTSVSDDGRYLAYATAGAGSDWTEWKVRDVATGKDLTDIIKWVKFSGAEWTPDGRGFFYSRFPEPKPGDDLKGANYYAKLYYHVLGTPQSADLLVWEEPERKEWRASARVTDDGSYLILTIGKGTDAKHRVLYRKLGDTNALPTHLLGDFDAEYSFIDNDGPTFWFQTNKNSPRGKVVAIDIDRPSPANWIDVIPQAAETLEDVDVVGEHFLARYLKDAHTQVRVFNLKGHFVREVEFPGLGTAVGFRGKKHDQETFYSFTSFAAPGSIFRYEIATGKSTLWRRPKLAYDPDQYETKQVFYQSKDGTRIPMFLSSKKGLPQGESRPALLYGYGGFNISLSPSFSPATLAWMEMGGLYAQPNLRGGGEYGEEWHQAGTRTHKQNVFDDFIGAAEWLIANEYTSTPKLAIAGGSNGGLLVGACMTQRPDLYGAALPAVGVMDMLRFHKFTIGWAWIDDYGSSDDPALFKALRAYSPLHNIKPGVCYPPTLVTTADHDDRVVPAHSFKFAATLQAAQACDNPVLIRIETRAGHGAGKPTTKQIAEAADKWAFLVKSLKMRIPASQL